MSKKKAPCICKVFHRNGCDVIKLLTQIDHLDIMCKQTCVTIHIPDDMLKMVAPNLVLLCLTLELAQCWVEMDSYKNAQNDFFIYCTIQGVSIPCSPSPQPKLKVAQYNQAYCRKVKSISAMDFQYFHFVSIFTIFSILSNKNAQI